MNAADRNRRRKAKIRRAKNRQNRTARGAARAKRRGAAIAASQAAFERRTRREAAAAPDANCVTLPDGDCKGGLLVGAEPCMHDAVPE